ncbi:hypothetical protein ACIRD3_07030 [Kitasatospora sp. NPDC093550]|uniref:hypothetical protein n=1 Tax=Kitasatospora sp. NPDC093550 TaxID=3364089 RepID=UPI0038173E52
MALSDGTTGTAPGSTGTRTQAAPDYSPTTWPAPVALRPRQPLDPLGTVLIPAPERQLYARGPVGSPPSAPTPTPPPAPTRPPAAAPRPPVEAPRPPADPPRSRLLALGGQARRRHLVDRIRVPLRACHRITVLGGPTAGGIAAVLGALLAEHRADTVLVLVPGGPTTSKRHPASRLVLHAAPPDPVALPATLAELSGHYPVILTDTTTSPVDLRPAAVTHADQLVICEPASATGARNAGALLDHLTALGRHDLVHGAATVFTPAPPTHRAIAERDLLTHFRTRCRGALLLPPHTRTTPLRPRSRRAYLELAALIGDTMSTRHH